MGDNRTYIQGLQRKWIRKSLLNLGIASISVAIIVFSLAFLFLDTPVWWLPVFMLLSFITGLYFDDEHRLKPEDVSRYLDLNYPSIQESSSLLMKDEQQLNFLEKLQVQKVVNELSSLRSPPVFSRKTRRSIIFLVIAVLFASIVLFVGPLNNTLKPSPTAMNPLKSSKAEILLPGILSSKITIQPPAYTRRKPRDQNQFNLEAEEGATIRWEIGTNAIAKDLRLVLNDRDSLRLQRDQSSGAWITRKTISSSGFYQVMLNGTLSELYQINIIKDQPPRVSIISPAPNLTIELGEPKLIELKSTSGDDYGIVDLAISATVARGKGEGVKFSEKELQFPSFTKGKNSYELTRRIKLDELDMAPGDELYYYVKATDSKGQENRTDVYIVTLPDTAELMSMEGMVTGVNLVPEYFRSQRQIIIDAEKLLRERDTIPKETFNNRSNNLGIDQKLLRLRYGKFLGEEAVTTIGEDHAGEDHDEDHQEKPNAPFGDAQQLLDEYGHNHDNAEDATFFEPELKAQLKATLNEMWNSELKLRTYSPRDALPYAYKALRLLKDLQQKSRVYVAKTGFNPPPIKADKRLSGELDKIIQPARQREIARDNETEMALRQLISVLQVIKSSPSKSSEHLGLLKTGNEALTRQAMNDPGKYLDAAAAIRRIINNYNSENINYHDLDLATLGLQKIVSKPKSLPNAPASNASQLSDIYFKKLKQARQ